MYASPPFLATARPSRNRGSPQALTGTHLGRPHSGSTMSWPRLLPLGPGFKRGSA
jgi:hypothetical protein